MNRIHLSILFTIIALPFIGFAQITEAYDDFEGNSNITSWFGDNCEMDINYANPYIAGINTSATVLRYEDVGGQYANVQFQMNDKFDLTTTQTFSLKIYVPSNGITGNQNNQISLKLQDGSLPESWTTQSEIIKPITLNEWQTVTFNFATDNYINLDSGSAAPTTRTDFSKVVIQVNGENNTDFVLAYLDDILLYETVSNDPVYDELIWSDEFDVDGAIDSDKWFHQTRIPDGGNWYNGEIQHYTDRTDNAVIEDGMLKIIAKKETFNDQGVTKQYTSARLNSKFAFTYGKIEIRAKLPFGPGTWPAMWTLGKNITETGAYWQTQGFGTTGWPACGEIDIMEHWGTNQNSISSAMHTPSSFGNTFNKGSQFVPNVSTEFHTYTAVWSEEKIVFSVDNVIHYTYNPTVKDANTWPFDLDQYILFNVAILPSIGSDFTESSMDIDYIRIYQESGCVSGAPDSDCDQDGFVGADDCDDNNPDINPNQTENPYNGIDDDCNPATLDDDLDQDGFAFANDCDDNNADINPNQTENPYNGIDDDCNPETLDDDLDQDGFAFANDCDDNNADINPNQTENPYNGIDDDCNPETLDDDLDQDGFAFANDCDDNNPDINPNQIESPYNGIDDDCNPETLDDDLDQDGFNLADDCDDNNADINPDAVEIVNNGIDEDCDGLDLTSATHELSNTTISIFPNPTITTIHIDLQKQLNFSATLYSLDGRQILYSKNQSTIDISTIAQGTYILVVQDMDTGARIIERILKSSE